MGRDGVAVLMDQRTGEEDDREPGQHLRDVCWAIVG